MALVSRSARSVPRPTIGAVRFFIATVAMSAVITPAPAEDAGERVSFPLRLRYREETSAASGRHHARERAEDWPAAKTALIVCDMWDLHHCLNATRRGTEMAPRMNALVTKARSAGATIIHAPSDCMAAYETHPARQRAREVPRARNLPPDIASWCNSIPSEEKGKYPIDQSDGGEDDDPEEHRQWAEKLAAMGRNPRAPWKTQTPLLEIADRDFITDSGVEVWSILEARGLDRVILTGVHTNMCVLGRPFGLRQMAKNGKKVVLVRDLTDTMYNPASAPHVSHFTGTDLIVEHVEKFVCPTVTSDQFLGGAPHRFAADRRPHLALVIAEDEYATERTLPEFALAHLGKDFQVSVAFGSDTDRHDVPGLEVVGEANVLLVSVRRRTLPPAQLARIRAHVEAGKPVVGIRTASHAFAERESAAQPPYSAWPEFDRDVIGGSYSGHHGAGPEAAVAVDATAKDHPLLAAAGAVPARSKGSLYKVRPLQPSATPLLWGSLTDQEPEPVVWTNTTRWGGKVFYTSLGHAEDFKDPAFASLLAAGVRWAAGR